jgi:uroporphyrinogen-III synthase
MQDMQPTLLLTRPKVQSAKFLSECETLAGRRLPVVVSPVMRIEQTGANPDLSSYATLIFTSANGVAACEGNLYGRRVVTVGAKTCKMATKAGAIATSLGEDVEAFLARAEEIEGPALFCRGTYARGNLADRLRDKGIQTDESVVYEQTAQPLTQAARTLLQSDDNVIAPLFSPRSAKLLCENAIKARVRVIAMSAAVAEAWTGPGSIDIVSSPTAANMASETVRHF